MCRHHRNWDYYRSRSQRNRGLQIDFVLASPSLAERVTGAIIDRERRLDESKLATPTTPAGSGRQSCL